MLRRVKHVHVLAISVALLIGGCGADEAATLSTDSGDSALASVTDVPAEGNPETPTPPSTPAGNPCAGTRGACEVVASVDVDGDNNPDNVGIELVDAQITVRIDTGTSLTTTSVPNKHIFPDDITPSGVFVGAFNITREQGADIVVDAKMGYGGFELFGMIGWDDGPVSVPAPEGVISPGETAYMWAVPTEMYRVFVRCPEPGSVGVVKTEADVSFGIVTPGGAYNETTTSRWVGDHWTVADTNRVPGQYVSADRSALSGTFECQAAHSAPPAFAPIAAQENPNQENPNMVLGGTPLSNSEGYGEIRPETVYFGGSPSGYIGEIVWDSWGSERAVGHGMAPYVSPTGTVASAPMTPAEIVAYEPSTCNGLPAYAKVQWYFPAEGQVFDPSFATMVC